MGVFVFVGVYVISVCIKPTVKRLKERIIHDNLYPAMKHRVPFAVVSTSGYVS